MQQDTPISRSWTLVALAILPGVFALTVELDLWQSLFHFSDNAALSVLLLVCGLLCLVGFIRERRFPTWTYPALGIMLASVSMAASASLPLLLIWIGIVVVTICTGLRRNLPIMHWEAWLLSLLLLGAILVPLTSGPPPTPDQPVLSSIATILSILSMLNILPAAIGLLLARRASLLAGLVFIGSAYVIWEGIGDPEYALLMWTDNQTIERVVSIHPQLFFLIVTPMLVLSVHSARVRLVSFLLPILAGFISASAIGSAIRPYASFANGIVYDFLFILLPLAICLALYSKANSVQNTAPLSVEA